LVGIITITGAHRMALRLIFRWILEVRTKVDSHLHKTNKPNINTVIYQKFAQPKNYAVNC